MSKIKYNGPKQFKPISGLGYLGYTILFVIPILGQILLIVFAVSDKKINRRNYARSFLYTLLIGAIITGVVLMSGSSGKLQNIGETLKRTFTGSRKTVAPSNDEPKATESVLITNTSTPTAEQTTKQSRPTPTAIHTSKPSAVIPTAVPETTKQPTSKPTAANKNAGIRKEVKEAIDGYEEFFKEYASFMKKYATSSNTLSMMTDYLSMMGRFTDTMDKWEHFDEEYDDLNDAELKYYTEASIRIQKYLLDVGL